MSNLIPCCILIPTKKLATHTAAFAEFLEGVKAAFGGYTFDREVQGSWIDRSAGIVHNDHSIPVSVSIPDQPSSIRMLKAIAGCAAMGLGELAIFVTIANRETCFVWAAPAGEIYRKPASRAVVPSSLSGGDAAELCFEARRA